MPESPDIIDQVIAGSALAQESVDGLWRLVFEARCQGVTWSEIGEALGVSRQAVQQRFSRPRPSLLGRPALTLQDEHLPGLG